MPRFPEKEADILALAERVIAGRRGCPDVFPHLPFAAIDMSNGGFAGIAGKNRHRFSLTDTV